MISRGRETERLADELSIFAGSILRGAEGVDDDRDAGRRRRSRRRSAPRRDRRAPPATRFFAMWRAMYEADRSTLVGSLPEKAPPPWCAAPP